MNPLVSSKGCHFKALKNHKYYITDMVTKSDPGFFNIIHYIILAMVKSFQIFFCCLTMKE